MLLFLARFLFGFVLSLSSVVLLVVTTWLCLKILALVMLVPAGRRTQDAAGALAVLALIAAALASLYGVGHALYGYMGTWPAAAGQTNGWLAGPRPVSPEALLGALFGFGGLAAAPSLWRGLLLLATARAGAAADKAEKPPKAAKPAKTAAAKSAPARAAAQTSAPAPKRPTIPQLGWLALFLLAIGAALLAFAVIVAPLAPASGLTAALHGTGRLLPIYLCALILLCCGLLCLLLWRVCRRRPAAASR